jgi:hypothetical protein
VGIIFSQAENRDITVEAVPQIALQVANQKSN